MMWWFSRRGCRGSVGKGKKGRDEGRKEGREGVLLAFIDLSIVYKRRVEDVTRE